ncbi:hypothetical protein RchiOBHm_Chr1g0371871 [Rosa chinensis]|uniref:Uncharacterized protein n=1 Tax=Rosa chinensis TaxID=74649 RepID=A0A2P6RZR8_ROSCH|nr:hypothetical protein RchiOBHm_Chr2g0149821 [Rosa chinensis]PRQ59591.1 hypothetical protein RchiOBHm_Chr1g0371871 [Rosa chinensis]
MGNWGWLCQLVLGWMEYGINPTDWNCQRQLWKGRTGADQGFRTSSCCQCNLFVYS